MLDRAKAAIQFGAVAQDSLDGFGLGHDDDRPLAQLEGVEGTELISPLFQDAMELFQVELMQIAQEGDAPGAGKFCQSLHVGNLSGPGAMRDTELRKRTPIFWRVSQGRVALVDAEVGEGFVAEMGFQSLLTSA